MVNVIDILYIQTLISTHECNKENLTVIVKSLILSRKPVKERVNKSQDSERTCQRTWTVLFLFFFFFANTNPGAGLMTELLQQVCCDGRHLQSPVLLLIWMSSLIIPQFPTWQLIKEKPGDRIFRFNTYWIPKEFFFSFELTFHH